MYWCGWMWETVVVCESEGVHGEIHVGEWMSMWGVYGKYMGVCGSMWEYVDVWEWVNGSV